MIMAGRTCPGHLPRILYYCSGFRPLRLSSPGPGGGIIYLTGLYGPEVSDSAVEAGIKKVGFVK